MEIKLGKTYSEVKSFQLKILFRKITNFSVGLAISPLKYFPENIWRLGYVAL
jgi:hypothetical protein